MRRESADAEEAVVVAEVDRAAAPEEVHQEVAVAAAAANRNRADHSTSSSAVSPSRNILSAFFVIVSMYPIYQHTQTID